MISVNEDGLVDSIYHFLWLTDDLKGKQMLPFMLPDTIIYRYQQPIFWFFSTKQGYIMRKAKSKLNNEKIKESFLKKMGASGIVAYYIYNKKRSENIIKELTEKKMEDAKAKVYRNPDE